VVFIAFHRFVENYLKTFGKTLAIFIFREVNIKVGVMKGINNANSGSTDNDSEFWCKIES